MSAQNIGILEVTPEIILDQLQFSGGEITNVRINGQGNLEFTIRHHEMPITEEADKLQRVHPYYTRYENSQGHFVIIRNRL